MIKTGNQRGFTFLEVIIAGLIMLLIIGAVVKYHSLTGASTGQEYYLKAEQTARSELNKLRSIYELSSGISEFENTGPPPDNIFLFQYNRGTRNLDLPSPMFHCYYSDNGYSSNLLKPMGTRITAYDVNEMSGVSFYHHYYCETFNSFSDDDKLDRKTFTYFIHDINPIYPPDSDCTNCLPITKCQLDTSIVVIDDMGSPYDCEDDLLGNIGWWVEDVGVITGVTHLKKITFALQFQYPGEHQYPGDDQAPGEEWVSRVPEVIVIKTTLVRP